MTHPAVIQNPAREKPLPFATLARRLGKSATTVWRWATTGVRGVVLESMQLGGQRCTSEEAWVRFTRRQQEAAERPHAADVRPKPPQPLSRESMQRAIAAGLAPKPKSLHPQQRQPSRRKARVQPA